MNLNRRGLGIGAMAALVLGAIPAVAHAGLQLSTSPGEPGFELWKRLHDRAQGRKICRVVLNGREVDGNRVDAADERAGTVRIIKLDDDGDIYVEPGTNEIAREILRGRVRIEVLV